MKPVAVFYQVLLLPSREVVARHCSLKEASAWLRTYNDVMRPRGVQAVIAEEKAEAARAIAAQAA